MGGRGTSAHPSLGGWVKKRHLIPELKSYDLDAFDDFIEAKKRNVGEAAQGHLSPG